MATYLIVKRREGGGRGSVRGWDRVRGHRGAEIYCKIISYLPATFADVSSAAAFSPRLPHYF